MIDIIDLLRVIDTKHEPETPEIKHINGEDAKNILLTITTNEMSEALDLLTKNNNPINVIADICQSVDSEQLLLTSSLTNIKISKDKIKVIWFNQSNEKVNRSFKVQFFIDKLSN